MPESSKNFNTINLQQRLGKSHLMNGSGERQNSIQLRLKKYKELVQKPIKQFNLQEKQVSSKTFKFEYQAKKPNRINFSITGNDTSLYRNGGRKSYSKNSNEFQINYPYYSRTAKNSLCREEAIKLQKNKISESKIFKFSINPGDEYYSQIKSKKAFINSSKVNLVQNNNSVILQRTSSYTSLNDSLLESFKKNIKKKRVYQKKNLVKSSSLLMEKVSNHLKSKKNKNEKIVRRIHSTVSDYNFIKNRRNKQILNLYRIKNNNKFIVSNMIKQSQSRDISDRKNSQFDLQIEKKIKNENYSK